jgi:hypothetical protein
MNGLSQLLPERKESNDVIFHHAPQHINLGHVLMFKNFLRWLNTPNSAVMSVQDTIHMECCIIRKTQSSGKSYHCQFSAALPHKVSYYSHGQLV